MAALTKSRVPLSEQAGDACAFDRCCRTWRQCFQALLRFRQRAAQELTFGAVELQRKRKLVSALQCIFWQQRRASNEIRERRGISSRYLGALASRQVQLCKLLALIA